MANISKLEYKLVRSKVECQSSDKELGRLSTLDECAQACNNSWTCTYFIYGNWQNLATKGKCFWEMTSASDTGPCPEGFLWKNFYDFYELNDKSGIKNQGFF